MFTTLNDFVNNAQSKYVIVPSCRIGCGISITEKPIFRTNTATSDTFVLSWILTGRGSFVAPVGVELLREEQLRAVEEHLTNAVRAAHLGNLDETEFLDIAKTLFEEEI